MLLGGFNDTPEDARRVVRLLSGLRAKVNLIPWNPGGAAAIALPDQTRVEEFRRMLMEKGLPAFVRYSRGQDIAAACGQLALHRNGRRTGAHRFPQPASAPPNALSEASSECR